VHIKLIIRKNDTLDQLSIIYRAWSEWLFERVSVFAVEIAA